MTLNTAAHEVIQRYSDATKNPGFAAALIGEWGCGKTHFVRHIITTRDAASKRTIYVSLYGIASSKEIDQAIFVALHPLLGGKASKFVGSILKGALKTSVNFDLDRDGKADGSVSSSLPDVGFADWLKPKEGTLLIFDDLERSSINVDLLLGYLNYLVEHCEMRCLLVVNENAMTEDQRKQY